MSSTAEHWFAATYRECLVNIRLALGGGGAFPRSLPTGAAGNNPVMVDLTVGGQLGECPAVTLIYQAKNAYIYGYVGSGSTVRFKGTDASKLITTFTAQLDFEPDYAAMGWQKNQTNRDIDLDAVYAALGGLASGKPVSKGDMATILIAFAEAARFRDIENAVVAGTPIVGKSLDWSSTTRSASDLLLKQG
ncbi:MAG TPA: ribosome-inactivating family protein [Crenalkalicoccus sp.]|nr:ribosome-inactivating family protein [Crenalkalicoccus sp.]